MTATQTGSAGTVLLPLDLAPSLTQRVLRLLAEVELTQAPELDLEIHVDTHRWVVCHRSGHHGADGRIRWLHRTCHRRLHRSGRHDVVPPAQQRWRYAR